MLLGHSYALRRCFMLGQTMLFWSFMFTLFFCNCYLNTKYLLQGVTIKFWFGAVALIIV